MSKIGIIAALLLLTGCATQLPGKIYRGTYFYHFEASNFTPEGSEETWCVRSTQMEKARLPEEKAPSPFGGPWGSADVVVRGELSPPGAYCSLSAYRYILNVYEILEVRNMKPGDPQDAP